MPDPLIVGPLGPLEIAIIVGVIVLLFGVGRISRIGGDLGSSIKEFRRAIRDDNSEQAEATEATEATEEVQAQVQTPEEPDQQAAPPAAAPTEATRSDSSTRNVF